MEFAAPKFKPGEIDRAGRYIGDHEESVESFRLLPDPYFEAAREVADNWRASHSYPLQIIRNNLANRAKKVSSNAIVAQRLKRFESIASKLVREPHMKLSQMQDLGGCRATALRRNQRPRASFPLAGFEVTLIGRFWVTPEAS